MYVVIWEYLVPEQNCSDFERIYGPGGGWSLLFQKVAGYLSTELFRDETEPHRYLTLDRWASREAYEEFQRDYEIEYKALDERCRDLTMQEIHLGSFTRP